MNDDTNFQKDLDPTDMLNLARWRSGLNNAVDEDVHPDSPFRNRPAYLDQPDTWPELKTGLKKDWSAKPDNAPVQGKDWDAKSDVPTPPRKDWSKLSR